MTAMNGQAVPTPPKDEKLTERPKPERGGWFYVATGPRVGGRGASDDNHTEPNHAA